MTKFVPWDGRYGIKNRVNAQPVTCDNLLKCLKFISKKEGSVFKQELRRSLIREGLGISTANDTIRMLKNFRFVNEVRKTNRIQLQKWLLKMNEEGNQKENTLTILATGIISGGYTPKSQIKEQMGTRAILSGLRRISTSPERETGVISLEDVARAINERGTMAIFCIVKLLGAPTDKDPYSLGILETEGNGDPKKFMIKLNQDILHSYQISIVSKYLSWIIPKILQKKYGVSFETALKKKLNLINTEFLRRELRKLPPVWIGSDEHLRDTFSLDSLIKDVTEYWGFNWWPEDRAGGGMGLFDSQHFVYVTITERPKIIPLKNRYHIAF